MKFKLTIFLLLLNIFLHAQSNEVKIGNDNTLSNVKISNKNLYVNNTTNNIFSSTHVDEVINLSPLFKTVERFLEGFKSHTKFNSSGLVDEYEILKNDLDNLINSTDGDHIKSLDNVLGKFLSLYVKALEIGAITNQNNASNAFVLLTDYKENKNDFLLEESVNGEFFLSNTRQRNFEDKDNIFVYPYKEGMAIIKNKNKFGFIDIYGNIVIDPEYDSVKNFSNGYAVCKNGSLTYILDTNGKIQKNNHKLHAGSDNINFSDFQDGWFKVFGILGTTNLNYKANQTVQSPKRGFNYYNIKFESLDSSAIFNGATDFCNGFAFVQDSLIYKKINSKGETIKIYDSITYHIDVNKNCLAVFYNKTLPFISEIAGFVPESYRLYEILNIGEYRASLNGLTLINSIKSNKDTLLSYELSKMSLVKGEMNKISYYFNRDDSYASLKDENDNELIKQVKSIRVLNNDYFLISSFNSKILSYNILKDFWSNQNQETHTIETYESFGILKPDSQLIKNENKDYNTLHAYNEKLFVFGKLNFSNIQDSQITKEKERKKNGKYYKNKYKEFESSRNLGVVFVKYGLVNTSGIEVLDMEYDKITLISENIVRTEKNGKVERFYIDDFGKAILIKEQSQLNKVN